MTFIFGADKSENQTESDTAASETDKVDVKNADVNVSDSASPNDKEEVASSEENDNVEDNTMDNDKQSKDDSKQKTPEKMDHDGAERDHAKDSGDRRHRKDSDQACTRITQI